MGLAGEAAVAIWHDIAPEGRAQFYAWHGHEHMPERVAIPGFRRGRRYVAVAGAPEFFNLYEVDTVATVTGPDYLARLNAPTPWTAETVRHFRNVARSLCSVAASVGDGEGGLIATFRYDVPSERADAHRSRIAAALAGLASEPGVAGAHLLIADEAASAVETAEKKVRADNTLIPRWIALVEGWGDAGPFRERCELAVRDGTFEGATSSVDWAIYALQNARTNVADRTP